MEIINESQKPEKQRHGCVTAWIILMLVVNSLTALLYLLASEMITNNLPGNVPSYMIIMLGLVGLANVFFSVLLLQWKKVGFWGFCATSVVALLINLSLGLGVLQSAFGLVGIAALYGILQIKKNETTAWENLD